jgi:hypothetical protein
MKRRYQKPPRTCIFCGTKGVSKEHLWSDWMGSWLTGTPIDGYDEFHQVYTMKNVKRGAPVTRTRPGAAYTKKLRVVCATCNNGWMSVIESNAKAVLQPLISGISCVLSPTSCALLTEWISLKLLVLENISLPERPADPIYDQQVRTRFMATGEPPPMLRVWIATCVGEKWQTGFLRHCSMLTRDTTPPVSAIRKNAQFVTWGIGRLLIHAVGVTNEQIYDFFELDAKPAGSIYKIWPIPASDIHWPPAVTLGDVEAEVIANTFHNFVMSDRVAWKPFAV